MTMLQFYTIKLTPNHKELSPMLIGITTDPEAFIADWLRQRTQFTGDFTRDADGRVRFWKGNNSYNKGWKDLPDKYRVFVQVDDNDDPKKDEKGNYLMDNTFEYKITVKPILAEVTLNVKLEGDAQHYL